MSVFVIIHTKVDDTETHHREIVPKIMEAVGVTAADVLPWATASSFESTRASRRTPTAWSSMSFPTSAWSACPRSETIGAGATAHRVGAPLQRRLPTEICNRTGENK
jgi:hypothetical protein